MFSPSFSLCRNNFPKFPLHHGNLAAKSIWRPIKSFFGINEENENYDVRLAYDSPTVFRRRSSSSSGDFDIFIFSQQWPKSVCSNWQDNHPNNKCYFPKGTMDWSIHGIWPSKYGTLGPSYCHTDVHWDEEKLLPIEKELKAKWFSVEEGGNTNSSFWEHEWHKHGTCALSVDSTDSILKYFKKALELINKYEMTKILKKSSINPGKEYSMKEIVESVQQTLGVLPFLDCNVLDDGAVLLAEIRICFDKNFNLIDCTKTYQFPGNCKRYSSLFYPGKNSPPQYSVVQV